MIDGIYDTLYVVSLGLVVIVFSGFLFSLSKRDYSFIRIRKGPHEKAKRMGFAIIGLLGILGGLFVCLIPVLLF